MAHDLDDFFSFERTAVGDETPDRARRITVRCRLGAREFATFRVDLALPRPDLPGQPIGTPPELTGIPEIDDLPPVLALAWPQQIAEKLCAIFEVHRGEASSRARDLADLAMISRQVTGFDGSELVQHLRAEAARRPLTLPDGLPDRLQLPEEQLLAWRGTFTRATRSAPIGFDDALAAATTFVDPVLDGSSSGLTWSAATSAWSG
jgi:hypothetical protein